VFFAGKNCVFYDGGLMERIENRERPKASMARAMILGIILIGISTYWVVGAENRIIYELTDFSIYPTVIFVLFLLALLNLIMIRYLRRFSLRPPLRA